MLRATILVDGYIQRVGYRYKTAYIARKHKLNGYVKNLDDGRVEIIVEGDEEVIGKFIKDINIKDPPIYVENIDVNYQEATNEFNKFSIIIGSLEEEIVEGFGTGASYLDNIRNELREFRNESNENFREVKEIGKQTLNELREFRNESNENFREVKEIGKQTLNEIIGLRQELLMIFDGRLKKVEEDIAKIKTKLALD